MKTGEIYWAKPEFKKEDKHPIICLEDCDTDHSDDIKVCILSTKHSRLKAAVQNVEYPKSFFNMEDIREKSEENFNFVQSHNFYVVCLGILKPISHMQELSEGTVLSGGIEFIMSLLKEKEFIRVPDDIQTYVNKLVSTAIEN